MLSRSHEQGREEIFQAQVILADAGGVCLSQPSMVSLKTIILPLGDWSSAPG